MRKFKVTQFNGGEFYDEVVNADGFYVASEHSVVTFWNRTTDGLNGNRNIAVYTNVWSVMEETEENRND